MGNIKYTWDQLHTDTNQLANRLIVDFVPDIVVGISRGGLIPAVILSHKFNARLIPLTWSLRDSNVQDMVTMNHIANLAYSFGKKVLIIDDIVDSGQTFHEIQKFTENNSNVKYASLWYNPDQSKAYVDYTINLIHRSIDSRWVVFAHET